MRTEPSRGPLLGSGLLVLAGVVIAGVPVQFASILATVGFGSPLLGIAFGVLVALSGVGVYLVPTLARELAVVGMAFSLLSLFGALGGFLVGTVLGLLGGNLCLAWKPDPAE